MATPTSNASLIFYPNDPSWIPGNHDDVVRSLSELKLISDKIENEKHYYTAGDKFLDYIAFMGCSPNINFSPGDSTDKYSYINLATVSDTVSVITSQHTRAPRCQKCGGVLKNWQDQITQQQLECTSCGQTSPPWTYDWRNTAGFCRFYIEITEIYPKEAIPQDILLERLENKLGVNWQYFYFFNG